MNSFKIISISRIFTEVEYTVGANTFTEKYDSSRLPLDDAELLEAHFANHLEGYAKDAVVMPVLASVKSLENKVVNLSKTKLAAPVIAK